MEATDSVIDKPIEAAPVASKPKTRLCALCGNPLTEKINTMAVLLTTRSSGGSVSEARGLFETCDGCFTDASTQMEELAKTMVSGGL